MTTGAAATSRFVKGSTAEATQSNTTPTKNTRRPSRSRPRHARRTRRAKMRRVYAAAFYMDAGATLDDVREAVDTLEDAERTARQVLGSAHPLTTAIERSLKSSRRVLAAHEALDSYQRGHNKQH